MRWFGQSWAAPINEVTEHARTPEGHVCVDCEQPIAADAQGVLLPSLRFDQSDDTEATVTEEPFHLKCFLTQLLGESA